MWMLTNEPKSLTTESSLEAYCIFYVFIIIWVYVCVLLLACQGMHVDVREQLVEPILYFHIWVDSGIELQWAGMTGKCFSCWSISQARTNCTHFSLMKKECFYILNIH